MSDKVALVRLRAKNDQYDAAMAKSKKATEDLAASSTRFAGMSDKLGQVGSDLTRGVTLPLALAGAASFKLAKDFGTTFTQMATLAGVPVSELEGLKQSVLDLAGETGQAPAALADSLYQIYSSGVPASEAMNVLRASAQGAALGLGDAAGVANAVTSAMNTYGASELSAAEATDQLTAAVKAGKGEASEFAPQLGNLLPVADMLGISFADTAGSLAFLTRGGSNAAAASTKLEGVMRALVKPTQQAQEVLKSVDLSADDLRRTVAEKGLPAALDLLKEKFGGNLEMMGKFFEDSEGYVGFQALMAEGGREWSKVLQDVNDSQGLVAEGMAILQDTPEFKAQQALAELQATAIEVGTQLMPILASLANGIADIASVFTMLPDPVQKGLVLVGLFAAALGPLTSAAGNAAKGVSMFYAAMNAKQLDSFRLGLMGVTQSGAGMSNAMGGIVAAAGGASLVMGALGGVVAGAGIIMWDAKNKADNFAGSMAEIRKEAEATGRTDLSVFADNVAKLFNDVEGGFDIGESDNAFRKFMDDAGIGIEQFMTALAGTDAEWDAFVDGFVNSLPAGSPTGPLIEDLKALRSGQQQAARTTDAVSAAQRAMASSTEAAADEQAGLTTETAKATDALSKQADEILGIFDSQRAAVDASEAYNQSIVDVAEAQDAEAQAAADVTTAEQELAQAHVDAGQKAAENAAAVRAAEQTLADAYKGREQALRAVEEASSAAADAATEVEARLTELADAQREATGDSDAFRDALEKVDDAEQALADRQADSLTAQQALTDARAEYSDVLAGLARDAGGAADDVLTAEIRLRDAQRAAAELGTPDKDGNVKPVSGDDRLAAEIAIREAERRLEEAKERAAEARAEYERNQAAGVEGSDAVVAAHGAVEDAAEAEGDAEQTLADAREDVVKVQEAAAQRVIDAQGRVEDALDDRRAADQRVIDSVGAVEEANGRISEAALGVEAANKRAQTSTDDVATARANLDAKKDAHIEAQKAVEDKLRDVEDAALDAALAIFDMDTKSGNAESGAKDLADELRDLAAGMAPGSPLRQYLLDTAAELDGIEGEYEVKLNLVAFEDSSFAALVSLGPARPGAANAERSGGAGVKGGSAIPAGYHKTDPGSSSDNPYGPVPYNTNKFGSAPTTPAAPASPFTIMGPLAPSCPPCGGETVGTFTPGSGAGSIGIDYDRLAAALATAKGITVNAPVDARGITNPAALSTVLSARLGMDLALIGAA